MENIHELRDQIRLELDADPPDFGRILELSTALAQLDPDYARFSIDASHISRLGLELVARQETALAELVKNGYDADARQVDLIFIKASRPHGTLEVLDDGVGMTRSELINGFMRISTQAKVDKPLSRKFGRRRAGRKGIGRFAAQRLGRRLTIITRTENAPTALSLSIDWEAFQESRDLILVPSRIEVIEEPTRLGTKLIIEDLRDTWSDAQIERAHRYISEFIQPFPLSAIDGNSTTDPGFKATFFREEKDDLEVVADDWTLYFQHALAEVTGEVDSNGRGTVTIKSDRLSLEDRDVLISPNRENPNDLFPNLRNVRFQAYYFIVTEIQKHVRAKVREKLRQTGGIRLYRNGFRVLPYGEPYSDWLGLDLSSRRRVILPPHANLNFMGFVEVSDAAGLQFEETSSREGLLETPAFEELRLFVSSALMSSVQRIAAAPREKK